jgi:energy-coupling factor transporter transmembrane protein EcfT
MNKDRGGIGKRTPYSYRPGNSALHRLPAWVKLLALLGISTAAFFAGFPALAAGAVIVTAGALSAGIRPWELLRGSKPLLIMIGFVILLRSIAGDSLTFSLSGCADGLLFGGTILVSFSAGALMFSVTTMTELKDSLGKIERILRLPLAAGIKKLPFPWARRVLFHVEQPRLSLGISLMLGFLPRFFEVWESVTAAYRARAGKRGISQIPAVIPPVIEQMMAKAGETASALESRGFMLK